MIITKLREKNKPLPLPNGNNVRYSVRKVESALRKLRTFDKHYFANGARREINIEGKLHFYYTITLAWDYNEEDFLLMQKTVNNVGYQFHYYKNNTYVYYK